MGTGHRARLLVLPDDVARDKATTNSRPPSAPAPRARC